MKTKEFTTYYTAQKLDTIKAIKKTEDLDLTVTKEDTTLGDTVICVKGSKEDMDVFKDVYNMVASFKF